METCIYNISIIRWGKPAPRPGLFVTPTWCEVSDNLIYSPIHQVYPGANMAVTSVLGGRWRTGGGSRGGGGQGDGIGCCLFLGPRRHEKHERFAQQLHEVINISLFSCKKIHPIFGNCPPSTRGLHWYGCSERGLCYFGDIVATFI